jgi:glutamate--cysteine ligase catalytic subunit
MGLLSLGTPLSWDESRHSNQHVRNNGIAQLINIFRQHHHRQNDAFLWGDEIEYMLVKVDDSNHSVALSIDNDQILDDLNDEDKLLDKALQNNVSFHPEYGRFMIEVTPASPYDGNLLSDYVYVEKNMNIRRKVSEEELPSDVIPLTLTTYPRMGCGIFTSPPAKANGPASQSLFLPDEIINRHVRFPTLTANIRKRKGHKVAINLPIYPDTETKMIDDTIPKRSLFPSDIEPFIGAALPGHVYMDSMGFGMGSSCVQITMQGSDINEARYLYDTLAPLTPVMLALSAAAPIFRGYLVNQDVRWNVVSGSVDDRTFIEKGTQAYPGYNPFGALDVDEDSEFIDDCPINEFGDYKNSKTKDGKPIQKIPKSRYDSIDNYLGGNEYFDAKYNDIYSPINSDVYNKLKSEGIFDNLLARHFAHLFIRDPIVIFSERVEQNNSLDNDHFENLQSTNWQTLRFKPPALYPEGTDLSSKPGWRVEFRPMDIQLTDFENAAYSNFISLLSKAIIKYKPNLYVPISKIDENMITAHKVDAAINEKFWFRKNWAIRNSEFAAYGLEWFDRYLNKTDGTTNGHANGNTNGNSNHVLNGLSAELEEPECAKYTSNDIINGNDEFPGIIKLIIRVIAEDLVPQSSEVSPELRLSLLRMQQYLLLISRRASGELETTARWIRNKVLRHPLYKHDSKVSEEINYDIIKDSIGVTNYSDENDLMTEFFGKQLASYLIN